MTSENFWGARPDGNGQWAISTWAPDAKVVAVEIDGSAHPLQPNVEGFWSGTIAAPAGAAYTFIIDGQKFPDPASHQQESDVHGPSCLTDPAYQWSSEWPGRPWHEAVIYELHIGTFTPEGTFASAAEKMSHLADLGFTAIEIMPIGQWSGARGWGYDGVLPYAPHPAYGTPDDLRQLIDAAQSAGLMVILDLVMNHFGPDGAYIHQTAPKFFDEKAHTPWGAAIDFDQPAVRRYWIDCALMWLTDYRLDGLRLDAVHQIKGPGADRFFADFGQAVADLDLGRPLHLIVEDERNEPGLRESGFYTATWNDDFHHAIHTALTGESQDYYAPFAVEPVGDIARALERGHVEEGQFRPGRDEPRGQSCAHLPFTSFVNSTQTHDQIGNRAHGDRLLTLADAEGVKTAYALLLLSPFIPMVFMGEERGATSPFLFFADYEGELAEAVRKGRAAEFAGIAALGDGVPDPIAEQTFTDSKIDWSETGSAREWLDLTRAALTFRNAHVTPLIATERAGDPIIRRTAEKALTAHWTYEAGELVIHLNFGDVGDHPPMDRDPDFSLFDITRDTFAIAAWSHSA